MHLDLFLHRQNHEIMSVQQKYEIIRLHFFFGFSSEKDINSNRIIPLNHTNIVY